MKDSFGKCNICKDRYTSMHVEVSPDSRIFVCSECIEKAKDNFIWLCMTCEKTYIKPKDLVINKIKDHELKRAYMLCKDMLIIQGIDMCIACNPDRIVEFMEAHNESMDC